MERGAKNGNFQILAGRVRTLLFIGRGFGREGDSAKTRDSCAGLQRGSDGRVTKLLAKQLDGISSEGSSEVGMRDVARIGLATNARCVKILLDLGLGQTRR